MTERDVLVAHDVAVRGDNPWQRRIRLGQALWRERSGLPAGEHRGLPLGSRITTAEGNPPILANYLSAPAKRQVSAAAESVPSTGAFLSRPRLWVDLLSSQPLCFNLFGPLAEDLDLATAALRLMWPHLITCVIDIRFEWSPGRGDPWYTGNRSAFDVFIDCDGPAGRTFLAIEIKYHEDMTARPAHHEDRYVDLARRHTAFRGCSLAALASPPLQQLWLDHLLALQLRASTRDDWDEGVFVLLSPVGNRACTDAGQRYQRHLADESSFDARTLDELVQAIRLCTTDRWIDDVYDRYLDPVPVARAGLPPVPHESAQRA